MKWIFSITLMSLASLDANAHQDRVLIRDGIYEYFVSAISSPINGKKINVHHEPLYFIVNQREDSSTYHKINRQRETMQINLFFSLTSEHVKKQLKSYYEHKGHEVNSVEPTHPAKTLIVLKNEKKEYDSIVIDEQSAEQSSDVFSAVFSIPEQNSDSFMQKLHEKKLSFFAYYTYLAENNSTNTYQIQSDYIFEDGFLDTIFKKSDELYFTKQQIDKLFSKAREDIEIFAYIEDEQSARYIDFQKELLDYLDKKDSKSVDPSELSNYPTTKNIPASGTIYRLSRDQLKEIGFEITDTFFKNSIYAKGLAIRNMSDHHIYLKNLSPQFYSLENQIEPIGDKKILACNESGKFDTISIQSNAKSITISKGKTLHTYLIKDCSRIIISKTRQRIYMTVEFESNRQYLFQFDELLAFQQQDITSEGELVMKLVPKNVYLFNTQINPTSHYEAYTATPACSFEYGTLTNNDSILINQCGKEHLIALRKS